MAARALPVEEVSSFLAARHGAPVTDVELLPGGYWSSAYAYRAGGRELVVRFGGIREGFEMDRAAMAFAGPDLPIPDVLEVGDAFGGAFAISVRHPGRFLEDVDPREAPVAGDALERTLSAMRRVPVAADTPVNWYPAADPGPETTWREWLLDGLVDDPSRHVSGWRKVLAADADLDRLYRACERRVGDLVDACPERRDLVHGDLLNRNVLIAGDASRITAVFSWKCSVRGDFLFDIAWCTFWGSSHPGIAAMDLWNRTMASPLLGAHDLSDAALRHHCYELQIGASHLGWHAWTGDQDGLRTVARRTAAILEAGPGALPAGTGER